MFRCTSWSDVSSSRNIFPLLNGNTLPASSTSHPHRFEELLKRLLDHLLLIHRGLKRRKNSLVFIPVCSNWHLHSFFCGFSFARIPHRLDLFTNTGLKAGNFFIGTYIQKAGDPGDIYPPIFFNFPPIFLLRTRNPLSLHCV